MSIQSKEKKELWHRKINFPRNEKKFYFKSRCKYRSIVIITCSFFVTKSLQIFYFREAANDINPAISRRTEEALKQNKKIQPYVLVVGPTIQNLTDVVIDSVKLQFPALRKALDFCFKAIFALDAKYPDESAQLWLFIQRALYGIDTRFDRKDSHVAALKSSFFVFRDRRNSSSSAASPAVSE